MIKNIYAALKHIVLQRRIRRNPETYLHTHFLQIIVSKEELKYQLRHMSVNENFVRCIAYGKQHPKYEECMTKACVKFALIGSMFYIADKKCVSKLPQNEYARLFDDINNESEADDWLQRFDKATISAKELYQRYNSVKSHCLRMLTSKKETYYDGEYRDIIEYIVNSVEVPKAAFENNHTDIPKLPFAFAETKEYILYIR